MENKNGRGIFLGVVSVATLIVAIIGATFAYFVASTNGNAGAAAANSVSLAGTLTFTETPAVRNDLIPVADDIMRQSYGQATNTCQVYSAAGGATLYGGCSTYTFTVTNTASVAQTIYIKLTPTGNSFTNLHYALFTDAPGSGTTPAAPTITGQLTKDSTTAIDLKTDTLTAAGSQSGTSVTYTLALWIHEIVDDQTTDDAGKAFTGTINVSSSDGTSNITGAITQVTNP